MASLRRTSRRSRLRQLRRRDVITTRDGWLIDLAAAQRIEAVRALTEDDSAEVERAMLDALADPLDDVRAAVVATLGARGSRAGVAQCAASAATWDPERFPLGRAVAWDVLVERASPEDAVPLVTALLADAAPVVDERALDAVHHMAEADAEVGQDALRRVLRALDHDDAGVRDRAHQLAVVLGRSAPRVVTAELADDRRAPAAAAVLGDIGDLAFVPDLVEILAVNRPAWTRSAAAGALGAIGGHDAARALRYVADDRNPVVRRAATDALARLAGLAAEVGDIPAVDGSEAAQAQARLEAAVMSADADAVPSDDPGPVQAADDDTPDDDTPDDGTPDDDTPHDDTPHDDTPHDDEDMPEEVDAVAVGPAPAPEPTPTTRPEAPTERTAAPTRQADGAEGEPDDPDAPWLRAHPPIPEGPPPRPRGARRPRGRP